MAFDSSSATVADTFPLASQAFVPPTANPQEFAIRAHNLGKMYRIYSRPQDRLKQMIWRGRRSFGQEFWALRHVSFQVKKGDSIGVIGRNGSGKSTLLQLIVGTLAATEGAFEVNGRVAALLELGSGFNPSFTGRENVFMNGAILGLSPHEMAELFDQIAAFADIGKFIDQPVKLYSSGMAVRLAFAVQVFVPKEILIVDEALSVGDEAFQRKCMRKLDEFQEQGGTLFMVSHNAQTIVRQCNRCLFLHNGSVIVDGPSKSVTDLYQRFAFSTPRQQHDLLAFLSKPGQASSAKPQASDQPQIKSEPEPPTLPFQQSAAFDQSISRTDELSYGGEEAEIFEYGMYDEHENRVNVLVVGDSYTWRYRVRFDETASEVKFGMMFKTVDGIEVAVINNIGGKYHYDTFEAGSVVEVSFNIRINLGPGTYYLNSGLMGTTATRSGFLHRRVDICAVRVIAPNDQPVYGLAYLEPHLEVQYANEQGSAEQRAI